MIRALIACFALLLAAAGDPPEKQKTSNNAKPPAKAPMLSSASMDSRVYPVTPAFDAQAEAQLLKLANQDRAVAGLPALTLDRGLTERGCAQPRLRDGEGAATFPPICGRTSVDSPDCGCHRSAHRSGRRKCGARFRRRVGAGSPDEISAHIARIFSIADSTSQDSPWCVPRDGCTWCRTSRANSRLTICIGRKA